MQSAPLMSFVYQIYFYSSEVILVSKSYINIDFLNKVFSIL